MGECIKEWTRFFVQLAESRWLVIVAAIWIQCSCGATYSFSIYSQTVKDTFNYDQKRLDTLAIWKDLGANIGIVSGLVFDWFSPQAVLAIGVIKSAIAFSCLWLSVTGGFVTPAFWQMCLYMFLAANGQTYFNTASIVTCVQNFPRNRGVVIGLMKGFIGLSGAITTQLYHAIYGNEPSSYLLMAVWLPTTVNLLVLVIVRPVPPREEQDESKYLAVLSMIAVFLAVFLTGVILLDSMTTISHEGYVAACVVIGGILLLPLGIVVKSELTEVALSSSPSLRQPLVSKPPSQSMPVTVPVGDIEAERVRKSQRTSPADAEASTDSNPLSGATLQEKGYRFDGQLAEKRPYRDEDHTVSEAISKVDFWLLCVAMACGMGGGLTTIDNTGQIAASLGYKPELVGTFISLFSIWNFLGRLGFGALSEFCLHKYKIGRPVLLASSQAFMALGYVMISSAIPGSLYPALTIIGLCYGAQWSLMPAITSELFGLSRFATLFNTITIASPIGAYFLSVQVLGRLYDAEAEKDNSYNWNAADMECYGAHCFRSTFIILAVVTVFGSTVCGLLAHRTKLFYARIIQNTTVLR